MAVPAVHSGLAGVQTGAGGSSTRGRMLAEFEDTGVGPGGQQAEEVADSRGALGGPAAAHRESIARCDGPVRLVGG